jgi:Tol biopolymer transport system component
LYLTDRDGSGQRQLYPAEGDGGLALPEWAWSPDGSSVVFVELGDIKRLTLAAAEGRPVTEALTDDGNVRLFDWR